MRDSSLSIQLLFTWILYNAALVFVLMVTCYCFDQNEYETIAAMAIFSFGLIVMQYDWWALRSGKYKQNTTKGALNGNN